MSHNLKQYGTNNEILVGENIKVSGRITGSNNRITFAGSVHLSTVTLNVSGDYNEIVVGRLFAAKGLQIVCGSHVPAHNTSLEIGENFSIEPNGRFLLYTSGNRLQIGKNCMFSNNVTVRCGESPHLLFDLETGEFLDESEGVFIGEHVWVGENVYITKSVSIGDECIVGACSVVTRRFDVKHAGIAGNPARVVRENIQWHRNWGTLGRGSKFRQSYDAFHSRFPKVQVRSAAALGEAEATGSAGDDHLPPEHQTTV